MEAEENKDEKLEKKEIDFKEKARKAKE